MLIAILAPLASFGQSSVLTQHNDNSRTGWYRHEEQLNIHSVRYGTFGKLFEISVDDQIYAQPLVVAGVSIPGKGIRNVVYLATVNNTVYAFDADSTSNEPYWQVNLRPANSRPPRNTDVTGGWCGNNYHDFSGNMGIVGTPVIDSVQQTMYVVSRDYSNSTHEFEQFIHALDITTGGERPGSPRKISASVPGSGDGSNGGMVPFDPLHENQRSGLLLTDGIVYIAWAAHCDWAPYHGWIIGYDQNTLEQVVVYNTTPDGYNGGIWMAGGGLSSDEAGQIYAAVGNGSVGTSGDPANLRNRSESALQLARNGATLDVLSFFTPLNFPDLEAADLDFGVTSMLLIPGTNRVMTGCKDGRIYLLDRNQLGGYNAGSNNVIQTIDLGPSAHLRSALAYYGGPSEWVYSWSENALLRALRFSRGSGQFDFDSTLYSGVQGPAGNNGAFLSISSNGSEDSTAILWANYAANGDANQSVRPGVLRAFEANDITHELWNSNYYSTDSPGNYAKFNCPTIANGKVYLGTFSNKLVVFGLTGIEAGDTCTSLNISPGKAVTASSAQAGYPADAAVDEDPGTAWKADAVGGQSLSIDLGERYDLCGITLMWMSPAPATFKILTSEDGISWASLVSVASNTDTTNEFHFKTTCRQVRVQQGTDGTSAQLLLAEFEIFGTLSDETCAEPSNPFVTNLYENAAALHWSPNGAADFRVRYKNVSAQTWIEAAADTAAYELGGLACGTDYLYQVRGICATADTSAYTSTAAFATLPCNSNCAPLPTRWTTLDVGDTGAGGSACYDNGVFELRGAGRDIWDEEDGFRYAFKTYIGDGEMVAHVVSMDQTNEWNKCGIMFRESLAPGSRHVMVTATSGNGILFESRTETGAYSNDHFNIKNLVAPYWLRLVKHRATYTAYASADSINWVQLGDPVKAGFGDDVPIFAGLALTSHNYGTVSVATIDHFVLTPPLEVEIEDFTASVSLDKTVGLQWTTTLEKGISSFIVERSKHGETFAPLDTVVAVNNGRFTQTYTSHDDTPFWGYNYYRLQVIHGDGRMTYSQLTYARVSISDAPLVYPNPVTTGYLHIEWGQEPIREIQLIGAAGDLLAAATSPAPSFDLPVFPYSNGIYILRIKTSSASYQVRVLVSN